MELASNGVLAVGPTTIGRVHGFNAGTPPGVWIMLFDATSVPADGAEPKVIIESVPNKPFDSKGATFVNGVVWALSMRAPRLQAMNVPKIWLRTETGEGDDSMNVMAKWLEVLTDPKKASVAMGDFVKAAADARKATEESAAAHKTVESLHAQLVKAQEEHKAAVERYAADKAALEKAQVEHQMDVESFKHGKDTSLAMLKAGRDELVAGEKLVASDAAALKKKKEAFEQYAARRVEELDVREDAVATRERIVGEQASEYQSKIEKLRELAH